MPLPGIKQFDLTGKVAVVTGGSKGLGHAMAAGLASAGANLLVSSRNLEEGQAVADELQRDFGVRAIAFAGDVASPDESDAMIQAALDEFGKVDILIANAGINRRGPIDGLSIDEFREVMDINVYGVWLSCRSVIPHMKKAGYGRIILMGSTLGMVGLADRTPYASSKGAVVQMARTLGLELAQFGITCNAICPGPFLTPMNVPIKDNEQTKKFIVGAVALERWGEMEEIQGPAIFLASDASSYVTGSLVTVDGGWTAR
ncbi:MAG: 2-deoxy-D-gluconate 3-dehydrogenase [Planctomycetaceae bacterium]|nr:2-deoxy-D-gluconate 3-dehydrogenase [Planctomycetaceae bacterium]